MKVYIILQYKHDQCKILSVYPTKMSAQQAFNRYWITSRQHITYHVIQKSIKGLNGLQLTTEGKQRFLLMKQLKNKIVEEV